MSTKTPRTIDLFAAIRSRAPLHGRWPDPLRFPLNQDECHVEDILLEDLRRSQQPLIVTGFSTLDRLIDFVSTAPNCDLVRVVFGSEPFESRRDVFSLKEHDLPQAMTEYWLDRGISVLRSAKLLLCIDRLKSRTLQVRYVARSRWRLHAKIYVGEEAATLGSSNFTDPGLKNQLEANARFEQNAKAAKPLKEAEARRYRETVQIAEEFWELGKDYTEQLIELLNQLLQLVPWREAVARASAELLEGAWAQRFLRGEYLPGDAALWPSQRLGIAQALYILKERGSVLLADATGSGKTRMGVHLIGAKTHEIISSNRLRQGKALLICPPAVIGSWQEESTFAAVHIDVFSHGSLSHTRSRGRDNVLNNLRRAQLLCVDEGHNFLNFGSNRSRQLLRNMADHVMLFTATPINRSAADLLRIVDMLGADNLDDSTIEAFGKMLSARSISRTLSEEEIAQLRREIAKFTVRRTKRMLNDLIDRCPDEYRDANGKRCRFPKHRPKVYTLGEPASDREKAARIRELSSNLLGVLHFRKEIVLPDILKRRGVTEEIYLEGRLKGASKLSQYAVMRALRSSRAALLEHLIGTEAAAQKCGLATFSKHTSTGNLLGNLAKVAGRLPKNGLSIALPDWLSDPAQHREACLREIALYEEIATLTEGISDGREKVKARLLVNLVKRFRYVLAFDSRPITLAIMQMLLESDDDDIKVLVATGDLQSDRADLLRCFSPRIEEDGGAIGLCSDSLSEGVNLQRAQAVVHLDMPSVVRIAEQRVGRIDRLDSPYKAIHAWWPEDAPEFALRTDETFIERYETVDNLLGSNLPLPESVRRRSAVYTAHEAIKDFETQADIWDGIDDAFSPVRALVRGPGALIPPATYDAYAGIKARVMSRVSLVSAAEPWAFFCLTDNSGVPKWILLASQNAPPTTDLAEICEQLRQRLGPGVEDFNTISPKAEAILELFLNRLVQIERQLLSRRKQRALQEMEIILSRFRKSAAAQKNQWEVDGLSEILNLLQDPAGEVQPDWEEVAARWLDLIRPVWYEKLQDKSRKKPLLLKHIRSAVTAQERNLLPRVLEEFGREFPAQRPADERIVSCVVGIDSVKQVVETV